MTDVTNPAFSPPALFAKSQLYIGRGLEAKSRDSADEYQLWASLALELLGKSSLSSVHPALVADPTHYQSLFAACGHEISPNVKTISAKTLFERLTHISKNFDKRVQNFCVQLALRRNAEIHSGESPFSGMSLEVWEARFWHAAFTLLQMQDKDLDQWLGVQESLAPRQVLQNARQAITLMVETRIEHASEDFRQKHRSPAKREELIEQSASIRPYEFWKEFDYLYDTYVSSTCPSCHSQGVLGGSRYDEYVLDDHDPDDPYTEYVEVTYISEEFKCLVCGLHLNGTIEVGAAGIQEEFTEIEDREREFEPEYGND